MVVVTTRWPLTKLSEGLFEKLKIIFSNHGISEQLVSNNGSGFTSQEFLLFMKKKGIRHRLTSLYHLSSNDLAKRTIQILRMEFSNWREMFKKIQSFFRYQLLIIVPPVSRLLMGQTLCTHLGLLHTMTSLRNKKGWQLLLDIVKKLQWWIVCIQEMLRAVTSGFLSL